MITQPSVDDKDMQPHKLNPSENDGDQHRFLFQPLMLSIVVNMRNHNHSSQSVDDGDTQSCELRLESLGSLDRLELWNQVCEKSGKVWDIWKAGMK